MGKFYINQLLTYFLRGLLFTVPLVLSLYVIIMSIGWVDGLLGLEIPGIGILIIFVCISIFGYLTEFFITRPFFDYFEKTISKIPLISIIYTSLKDLIGAFVGDKKKFKQPVLVQMDEQGTIFKLGFVTKGNLEMMGLTDMVSVYLPHSYNFSGNQYIVAKHRIKLVNINTTQAMKFIVSGGVSGFEKV